MKKEIENSEHIKKIFSAKFIEEWKKMIQSLYHYSSAADFLVVPSLAFSKTYSYLPLLNYTDVYSEDTDALINSLPKGSHYLIRALNPNYREFQMDETVTMRLDLKNRSENKIWDNSFDTKLRNQIRKAQKSVLTCSIGNSSKLGDDFYFLYSKTMHKYGTPPFSKRLFEMIAHSFKMTYVVVYDKPQPVCGLILLFDQDIAHVPWAGALDAYRKYSHNNLMYWEAIKFSLSVNCKVFDFGRSGYGTNTFQFKKQWGAVPIKIDLISDRNQNVYSKYTLASKVWKCIPPSITNSLGPVLCRYLVDL